MDEQIVEKVIYENRDVKITTSRAIIGPKTYAMSNITSVSMQTESIRASGAVALFLLGGLVAVVYGLVEQDWLSAGGGLLAIILAFYMNKNQKTYYLVKIGAASGETNALKSENENLIREIVAAMNDAIVSRG